MKFILFLALIVVASSYRFPRHDARSHLQMSVSMPSMARKAVLAIAISSGLALLPVVDGNFHSSSARAAQEATSSSIFEGRYKDPNHPEGTRTITVKGKIVTISGSDSADGSKPFKIMAKEDTPGVIFVDFSPKGGPSDLLGVFDERAQAIKWPDGNSWTKL